MKQNYMIQRLLFGLIPVALVFFNSCKKDFIKQNSYQSDEVRFPQTDQEKELTSLTREIRCVLDTIYKHSEVVTEVDAAIYSGYDADESIVLKELLQPQNGSLYQYSEFKKRYFQPGQFFKYFSEEVAKNNYPLIIKYYGQYLNNIANIVNSPSKRRTAVASAASDTSLQRYEVWVVNNTKIYFPYSENFASNYDPDKPNNQYGSNTLVTHVSADRDADSGPGYEPYYGQDPGGSGQIRLMYRSVTVNDAYAETKATHIVNTGSEADLDPPPPNNPPTTVKPIYPVYISWVRCTNQYDRLISFTGNGGGSELRFANGFASQDPSTAQVVPNFPFSAVDIKRKDIRKGNWVHPYQVWNTNWKTEQTNNVLGIWEEDNQGSKTFNASVGGTFKTSSNTTVTGSVGISQTIPSQDAIIRNISFDRDFFFATAASDQGFGFKDSWPIRDGNSNVSFTMPYQIIQ